MRTDRPRLMDIALLHYPVVNKRGETIGSAVTNLDLHDLARAGRTYGIDTCWIVTPYDEQRKLARRIISHWTDGYGGKVNPDRREALSILRICSDLDEVLAGCVARWGKRPRVLATCASPRPNTRSYETVREQVRRDEPHLLLFGTAWGLSPEVMAGVDATLPPLKGRGEYNHLSVRSAVAIILDRLLAER